MKRVLLTGAVLAALAFATQATAANYQVMLGEQQSCGFGQPCKGITGVPKGTTLDKFLPGTVVINAGDTVTYSSASFHTVSYAPKVPPLLMPDPAKGKYASLKDAAGTPFYFGGLPKFIYNGLAFGPYGPKTISGSTADLERRALAGRPQGEARDVHLHLSRRPGRTTVLQHPPGDEGHDRRAGRPVLRCRRRRRRSSPRASRSRRLRGRRPRRRSRPRIRPTNTVYMGVGNGATVLGYLPQTLTVKAGTTVTFVNKSPPEVHNVVFGPKKYILGLEKTTDLFPTGPNSPNQVSPFLIYGSEPKGQYNYDGTNHGNGYFSTPLTSGSSAVPIPRAWKVTFTKPGKYSYFCWIHGPDMSGKVVVTN